MNGRKRESLKVTKCDKKNITKAASCLLSQDYAIIQQIANGLSPIYYAASDVQFQRLRARAESLLSKLH